MLRKQVTKNFFEKKLSSKKYSTAKFVNFERSHDTKKRRFFILLKDDLFYKKDIWDSLYTQWARSNEPSRSKIGLLFLEFERRKVSWSRHDFLNCSVRTNTVIPNMFIFTILSKFNNYSKLNELFIGNWPLQDRFLEVPGTGHSGYRRNSSKYGNMGVNLHVFQNCGQ